MELYDKFEESRQAVFDYFGYVEDWVVIPLDDKTDYFWELDQNENGGVKLFTAILLKKLKLVKAIVIRGQSTLNAFYQNGFIVVKTTQWFALIPIVTAISF